MAIRNKTLSSEELAEREYEFLSDPDRTCALSMEQLTELLYKYCTHKYDAHVASCKDIEVSPVNKRCYVSSLLKWNGNSFDKRCQAVSKQVLTRIVGGI